MAEYSIGRLLLNGKERKIEAVNFVQFLRARGDKNSKSRYNRAQSGKPTMFCISMSTTTMMTMTLKQEPLLRARW
jgi:hypothetical protein